MKNNVTIVDFGDLLRHATDIGFDWNEAHGILTDANIYPLYEASSRDIYKGESEDYGYSEDASRIIETFMEKHELNKFTLV